MLHQDHSVLIRTLLDCAFTCENCATACLSEREVTPMAECIKLDRDCADMCRQAAVLLQRDSKVGHKYLTLCAEICRMCGEECRKHAAMKHCKECSDMCMKCAEACENHVKLTAAAAGAR